MKVLWFEGPGPENTEATLRAARERAGELGIRYLVVATSTGRTGLKATEIFRGTGISVVCVTLHAGLWKKYCSPDPEVVRKAEGMGAKFLTATHSLMGNVEAAIKERFGGLPPVELIAHTLYLFSQGTKVAVEVAVMAADAGLIPVDEDVISVAGTDSGADTALVLKPAYSTDFFGLKVREVLAMPR
ncbi:MAG TPA: hypothetical protein EYP61_00785 [Candidatus Latescibacteria bacterium]|nr:hypothetical protein [Candidatus Latescibacterota bacterium]